MMFAPMLIGALGATSPGHHRCAVLSDGCLGEKGEDLMTYLAVRKATDPQKAQRLIADALPSLVA